MRDIAITLLLIGLVPVILRRPWIGILAWYVISLVNPHKLAWGFAQELPVANVVGICTLVGLFATKERRGVAWTPEMVLLALFALFVTLTTVFAWNTMLALEQWYKVIKIYLLVFVSTMPSSAGTGCAPCITRWSFHGVSTVPRADCSRCWAGVRATCRGTPASWAATPTWAWAWPWRCR